MHRVVMRPFAALALLYLAACSGGSDTPSTPTQTPTIGVSLAASTLALTSGGSPGMINVTVSRGGGYTGAVDLTVEGAPTGVNASFAPVSVANGSTTSVLTLTAGTTAVAGGSTLTVRARGTGTTDQTATIALTVAAPVTPAFALTLGASTLSVQQGATGTVRAAFARSGGFAGAVGVTVEGLPTGVTATAAPASATGDSSVVTFTVGAAAATGTYNLTVRGTATGLTDRTAALALTVTAPAAVPAYTLTLGASTLSVQQGATGTVRAGFARSGGFTGGVAVAVEGLPTGVTATPAPASATGDSSIVTLTVGATAAPGTYNLTVRGTATGLTDRTAPLALTVTAAPAAGSYTLAVAPTTLTVAPGASGTATVNLTRTNGFAGAVGLAITGAPTGLTATLASASTTGNAVGVTIATTTAVAPGTYALAIRGTATGLTDQTATLTVTVAVTGSFGITVTPATVSVTRGATSTVTVDINRTGGFTGGVDITVSGLPIGVTATIAPATSVLASRTPRSNRIGIGGAGIGSIARDVITTNKATITLTASTTANTGPFTLTVNATAAGLPAQTATSAVTVATGPTPGSGNIAWQFCDASLLPIWFAYQDGTGAWTQVAASANTYRFDLPSGRGGVAFVTNSGTGYNTLVYYGTAAELTSYGVSQCVAGTSAIKSVRGTVAGASGTDQVYVGTTGRTKALSASTGFSFALDSIPDGARDFYASKVATSFGTTGVTQTLSKLILRRGLNPANGSTLAAFDFNSAEAFDPQQRTLTIGNTNGDIAAITMQYLTNATSNTSAGVLLYSESVLGLSGTRTIYTVPAAQQRTGDLHSVSVVATPLSANTTNIPVRSVTKFFAASADQTVTLGPVLNTPTTSSITATRFRVQLAKQTEYGQVFAGSWFQTGSGGRSVTIIATTAYNTASTWDVSIPDLSGAGYSATWGLVAGAATSTTFTATGYDFNATNPNAAIDGGTVRTGVRTTVAGILAARLPFAMPSLAPGMKAVFSRRR